MKHTIRRLNIGEGDLYRRVRLESLEESPDAFASTYEAALDRSEESWSSQADASASGTDRATFIVLSDRPVGLAAIYRMDDPPEEGELLQVWVAPGCRGGTVAGDLVDALFHWASGHGFEAIRAEVTSTNERALRFYEKYGFLPRGAGNTTVDPNRILIKNV